MKSVFLIFIGILSFPVFSAEKPCPDFLKRIPKHVHPHEGGRIQASFKTIISHKQIVEALLELRALRLTLRRHRNHDSLVYQELQKVIPLVEALLEKNDPQQKSEKLREEVMILPRYFKMWLMALQEEARRRGNETEIQWIDQVFKILPFQREIVWKVYHMGKVTN